MQFAADWLNCATGQLGERKALSPYKKISCRPGGTQGTNLGSGYYWRLLREGRLGICGITHRTRGSSSVWSIQKHYLKKIFCQCSKNKNVKFHHFNIKSGVLTFVFNLPFDLMKIFTIDAYGVLVKYTVAAPRAGSIGWYQCSLQMLINRYLGASFQKISWQKFYYGISSHLCTFFFVFIFKFWTYCICFVVQ